MGTFDAARTEGVGTSVGLTASSRAGRGCGTAVLRAFAAIFKLAGAAGFVLTTSVD